MDGKEQMLTAHQRHWLQQIKACEASGKSVSAYATEHGFQVRSMYDAKKILVKKGVLPRTDRSRFQRVQRATVTTDTQWRIRLPNGVSVEYTGTVDVGSLSIVLNTVARLE